MHSLQNNRVCFVNLPEIQVARLSPSLAAYLRGKGREKTAWLLSFVRMRDGARSVSVYEASLVSHIAKYSSCEANAYADIVVY